MRPQTEPVFEKFMALPPAKRLEVEDFIDFLRTKQNAKFDFPTLSVGKWPAQLDLGRESLYGDEGR